jgi:putative GTP pyrophosphokinase
MMDINEYLKFRKPYERVLRQLLLELDFFIEEVKGVNINSVQHRLKSYNSARDKSIRTNQDISQLHDIAGIRIVVATFAEVEIIAKFFSRKQVSNDLVIKWDEVIEKDDGYRARHIVVEFKGHYSRFSSHPTLVEIQLQTILQNAYNFISRAWVYKNKYIYSNDWDQSFKQVSKELNQLDQKISELQEEVLKIAEGDNEALTPFSYQRIVADIFSENVDLDDAVDISPMLVNNGINTNEKLKKFLLDPRILSLRERFLNLESEHKKGFVVVISGFPLHIFWLMFGIRLKACNQMLDELESTVEPKE